MKKYYLSQELVEALLAQEAELEKDEGGYYVTGWTRGVAAIDLFNRNNCATYLCWYEKDTERAVGIKAYFNQFKEA